MNGSEPKQEPLTGSLRQDIVLLPPGKQGNFALIFDPQADAYYRINEQTMKVISYLTNSFPLTVFLQHLKSVGIFLEKEDLLQLLSFLQQNHLLKPDYGIIEIKRKKLQKMKEQTALLRFSAAYLFFKLPPWRPEKFLAKVAPLITWLASRWFLILLFIPAFIGFLQIIRHFSLVRTTFIDSLSWAGLAKYFIAIIILKLIHESAHAIAATHFKCRVRGIGLGFMVFYPRLFTDTTDSWRLPRRQRFLIDGAGIIIELLVGGIAALLWTYLSPGALKSTMFYIFAVSTISTLFINGNPCIRYDGYYLLCDMLNIENLMTRSSDYIKQFWRWHFLRLGSPPSSEHGGLFLCFGVLSFVYRLFLYTSIILVIYHTFIKAVAIILVFLELYSIMIYPFFKEIQTVRQLSKQSANWARFYLLILFIGVSSLILFFPLGWNIHLPGEIVPKSQQWVTTNETGFLCDSLKRHAFPVKKNDLICQTHSPHLNFEKKRSQESLRYDLILFDQQQLDLENLGNSQVSKSKIKSDQLVLEELNRREKDLCIKAESDGIFVPEISELSPGAYLPKGYTIGKIVSQKKIIYAYVNEREISKLSLGQKTTIRNADTLQSFKGRISYINPIPSTLKNSPLLQHFGGPIPVYIDNKNPEHYESVFSLFRIEIELDEPITWQIGRTVEVSVHHSERLWERLQQFVISALRREF